MFRRAAGIAAATLVVACSSGPSAAQRMETAERAAMAPLKAAYPGAVMGFDFHGSRVDVSIDMNGLEDLDDDTEAAMKAKAVALWRSAWTASHPHRHEKLTVRLIDFQGRPQFTLTTKA